MTGSQWATFAGPLRCPAYPPPQGTWPLRAEGRRPSSALRHTAHSKTHGPTAKTNCIRLKPPCCHAPTHCQPTHFPPSPRPHGHKVLKGTGLPGRKQHEADSYEEKWTTKLGKKPLTLSDLVTSPRASLFHDGT